MSSKAHATIHKLPAEFVPSDTCHLFGRQLSDLVDGIHVKLSQPPAGLQYDPHALFGWTTGAASRLKSALLPNNEPDWRDAARLMRGSPADIRNRANREYRPRTRRVPLSDRVG